MAYFTLIVVAFYYVFLQNVREKTTLITCAFNNFIFKIKMNMCKF